MSRVMWYDNHSSIPLVVIFFFFNDTATTEIYTLSLHDALPISRHELGVDLTRSFVGFPHLREERRAIGQGFDIRGRLRSEEHTSELQSPCNIVCRLLLEKKNKSVNPGCDLSNCVHIPRHRD